MLERVRSVLIRKILESDPDRQKRIIERLIDNPKKKKTIKRLDYNRNGKWTNELIIVTLRKVVEEYGKLTVQILEELRKKDPQSYPAQATVRARFGSWMEVRKAVGGIAYPPSLRILKDFTARDINYFLNIYHQGNVKSYKDYLYARKKFPESVPSYYLLTKIFGTFKNFRRVAEIDSCRDQLDKLLNLSINLNKFPSKKQCKLNEIDIDYLIERFFGLPELKRFVLDLKSSIEIAIKSKDLGGDKIERKRRNRK